MVGWWTALFKFFEVQNKVFESDAEISTNIAVTYALNRGNYSHNSQTIQYPPVMYTKNIEGKVNLRREVDR